MHQNQRVSGSDDQSRGRPRTTVLRKAVVAASTAGIMRGGGNSKAVVAAAEAHQMNRTVFGSGVTIAALVVQFCLRTRVRSGLQLPHQAASRQGQCGVGCSSAQETRELSEGGQFGIACAR